MSLRYETGTAIQLTIVAIDEHPIPWISPTECVAAANNSQSRSVPDVVLATTNRCCEMMDGMRYFNSIFILYIFCFCFCNRSSGEIKFDDNIYAGRKHKGNVIPGNNKGALTDDGAYRDTVGQRYAYVQSDHLVLFLGD